MKRIGHEAHSHISNVADPRSWVAGLFCESGEGTGPPCCTGGVSLARINAETSNTKKAPVGAGAFFEVLQSGAPSDGTSATFGWGLTGSGSPRSSRRTTSARIDHEVTFVWPVFFPLPFGGS
jgi:hypothetical protein